MNHRNSNRRRFLSTALVGGVASHLLPFVPAAVRAAGASPRRLLVIFHPMGWLETSFFPTLAANKVEFELGESMKPVEAHKNKLIFMDGLENRGGIWTYGFVNGKQLDNEHGLGMSAAFTGCRKDSTGSWANGPSIDQVVADKLYADTPTKFRNIALGVNAGSPGGHSSAFFSKAETPVNPQNSAKAAFDTLFKDVQNGGGGAPSADLVARARRQRQSVIDLVRAELNALCGKAGQAEKDKCDAHLAALRQQENALAQLTVPVAATCTKPASPVTGSDLVANIHAQMDIVAASFTCDLARVATIQMGGADGGLDMIPGINHHDTTHKVGDTNAAAGPVGDHKRIDLFFANRYAYLLNKLDAIQEADGTLLDNTLILFGSDTTTGMSPGMVGAHNAQRFPFWMAGGGNFAFKTGRALQYTTPTLKKWVPHNRMLVSVAQKFGLAIDKFGTLDPASGPLPML